MKIITNYLVPSDCDESIYQVEVDTHHSVEERAAIAAEDFYHNHDGNEHSWPMEVIVHDRVGREHRVSVDTEPCIHFTAKRVEGEPV